MAVRPKAAFLLQSMRDIGYTFETAVADLIDNSISAKAKNVWIDAEWRDGEKFVAISDDGNGLGRADLIEAMRLGSADPTASRSADDLGRFGLGLKTASLSQCRKFTIVSKTRAGTIAASWDIDVAVGAQEENAWDVAISDCTNGSDDKLLDELIAKRLKDAKSGTIVLWEKIDRPDPMTTHKLGGEQVFTDQLDSLVEHLDLTYHRFLDPESEKDRVLMFVNGRKMEGFNPFNPKRIATKRPEPEELTIRHEKILVTPFVLPHPSMVSAEEYRKYEGKDGYLDNAGFYIYRNKRLISKGTWFRLVKRTNLTKLLRIQVDIPTSLDALWGVDVRKSKSEVPADIRAALKTFIEGWEREAKVVYEHRGTKLIEKLQDPLWRRIANDGAIHYELNRDNLFLQAILDDLPKAKQRAILQYLDMAESSFPHTSVMCDLDKSKSTLKAKELPSDEVVDLLKQYLEMSGKDLSVDDVLRVGVFHDYPDFVRGFMEGKVE